MPFWANPDSGAVQLAYPGEAGRSLIVDPDGRVRQQAGEHETTLTEILDLDHVSRAHEFGTLGLCQLRKQLRGYPHEFPIYDNGAHWLHR